MMTELEKRIWEEAKNYAYTLNEDEKPCTDDNKRREYWVGAGLSLESLVKAFIEIVNPEWKDIIRGDKVKLSSESDNENIYKIHKIDYKADYVEVEVLNSDGTSKIYEEGRAITRYPKMTVVEKIPRPKNNKKLF